MKKSPQKLSKSPNYDSSKLFRKEGPIKLDQAIERMSNLLGDHLDLRGQTSAIDLPTNSLEDYVSLLNERYNKIVELLSTEEENLLSAQQENSELKAKFAEEVKNHQDTVELAKGEIENLVHKNQEILAKKHAQNMEKQYKEIEVKCNEERIEMMDEEIKKSMQLEIQLKDEIAELERNTRFLEEELDSIKSVTKAEENRNKDLEKKHEDMQKDYELLKKQFNVMKTKCSELDQKINTICVQKTNYSDNTGKIIQEQKSTLKKTHTNYQKLAELEKLKKKLLEELDVKNEQLTLIRNKNQELESRIKGLEFVDKESKIQEEINEQLIVEKEVLTKKFEEISNLMGKNSMNRILHQSNRKVLEAKNIKEFENLIKNNPNFDPNEPYKLLNQNSKYKALVENLEKEINEKANIIGAQNKKIKEMQEFYENNNNQLEQEIEEKNILENKYDEFSKKMGFLSTNYQNFDEKKTNQNKYDKKEQISNNWNGSNIEKKVVFNETLVDSPQKKEIVPEKQSSNKAEKLGRYKDYELLNKNPIKFEFNEGMKVKNSNGKDLKTLDNF